MGQNILATSPHSKQESQLHERATEVIKNIRYMNLATVGKDGNPWNSPVFSSFDTELHFFWLSWKQNQHSVNIGHNPNVFVTIYDSTVPEGTGFGVYLQGKAEMIEDIPRLTKALAVNYARAQKKARAVKLFLTSYPRRAYIFTPEKIWVNGDDLIKTQPVDIRHELNLETLKTLLNSSTR